MNKQTLRLSFVGLILFLLISSSVIFLKNRLSPGYTKEHQAVVHDVGNGPMTFADPRTQTWVRVTFTNGWGKAMIQKDAVRYHIFDILPPVNLNPSEDATTEHAFLLEAIYPDATNSAILAIARKEDAGDLVSVIDQKTIGPRNHIEDIHSTGTEVLIEAFADSPEGKQRTILSYTFSQHTIVPSPYNIDITKPLPAKSADADASPQTLGDSTSNAPENQVIYLTFDDGPGVYTPDFLDVLKTEGVKATFFVIGNHAKEHPAVVKRAIAEGHKVYNHTYTHPDLRKYTYEKQKEEMKKTQDAIKAIADSIPTQFRPPYGSYNKDTDTALESLSLKRTLWTVDPRDWSGIPAMQIYDHILSKAENNAVILMHDGVVNSKETLKALPGIIKELKSKNFHMETL